MLKWRGGGSGLQAIEGGGVDDGRARLQIGIAGDPARMLTAWFDTEAEAERMGYQWLATWPEIVVCTLRVGGRKRSLVKEANRMAGVETSQS